VDPGHDSPSAFGSSACHSSAFSAWACGPISIRRCTNRKPRDDQVSGASCFWVQFNYKRRHDALVVLCHVVLLPGVDGSALIHDLEECVVVLGYHQVRFELFKHLCFSSLSRPTYFRMHASSKVDVYLSITSNPTVEHCQEIRFARISRCENCLLLHILMISL
jgi:hypothetical protein